MTNQIEAKEVEQNVKMGKMGSLGNEKILNPAGAL